MNIIILLITTTVHIITPTPTTIPITAHITPIPTITPTIGIMTMATDIMAIAMDIGTKDNCFLSLIVNGDLNFQVAIFICQARRKVGFLS